MQFKQTLFPLIAVVFGGYFQPEELNLWLGQ